MALTTVQQVQATFKAILRADLNEATATAVAAAIDGGTTTMLAYQNGLIAQASTTTTAAVAMATLIEGLVPTSARVDSLTEFAKTQFDYYTNTLKSANAQLGAYEALGKAFAADSTTSASFAARYGALSATDFVTTVYAQVFNANPVPTAGALENLVGQIAYFTKLYTDAGIPAADAALQAKGAVFGQIMGYAATTPEEPLLNPSFIDEQVEGFIAAMAAEARAETSPSLVYGVAGLGVTIDLTVGPGGAVAPTGAPYTTTQYADKISGTVGTNGFADTVKVDGGLGIDSLTVTTAGGNYAPAADIIKNIEKLSIVATGADATASVSNVSGLTEFTFGAGSTKALAVTGLDTATSIHVKAGAGAGDFTIGFASAPASAKVSVDAAGYTGKIAFSDAAVKSVTADATVAGATVNFGDNDLTSVTVTSKADVSMTSVGTGLKTLDLTGVGTFSKVDLTGAAFANAVTATLGAGADIFQIDANKAHVITLGAEADTVEINAAGNVADVSTDAKVVASVLTITDFSKADADILRLDGGGSTRQALDATALGQIAGSLDLKAAATLAGTFTNGSADDWAIFNFGGSAYALFDNGNDGFNVGDTLVKLTGFAVADLTATNLFIA